MASALPLRDNEKIFDSVLVISDRNVIDGQLQDAVYGFERTAGVVATIKRDAAPPQLKELRQTAVKAARLRVPKLFARV